MLSENEENIRKELLKLMQHFQCPVCLNLMSDPMVTRCVHRFCSHCINKAIESSVNDFCRCPLCNEKITKRALRHQLDVSDLINALKDAVDSFERDNQWSIITNADEVVVFDVSTDKSKSCAQINDSIDESIESKEVENKTQQSMTESNDIATNRKTTTITTSPLSDWPTCDTNTDMNETEVYFDSNKSAVNDSIDDNFQNKRSESINGLEGKAENKYTNETNATQSQNLKVNKSKITYSSSRHSRNDKFDRIIGLSNYKIDSNNRMENKPKEQKQKSIIAKEYVSSESESEVESIGNELTDNLRKPLIQLKTFQNKNCDQKNKKRIKTIDSSDNEFSSPLVVNTKRRDIRIRESNAFENGSDNEDMSGLNKTKDSVRNESSNGYNSDTQLISSSPISDF